MRFDERKVSVPDVVNEFMGVAVSDPSELTNRSGNEGKIGGRDVEARFPRMTCAERGHFVSLETEGSLENAFRPDTKGYPAKPAPGSRIDGWPVGIKVGLREGLQARCAAIPCRKMGPLDRIKSSNDLLPSVVRGHSRYITARVG